MEFPTRSAAFYIYEVENTQSIIDEHEFAVNIQLHRQFGIDDRKKPTKLIWFKLNGFG